MSNIDQKIYNGIYGEWDRIGDLSAVMEQIGKQAYFYEAQKRKWFFQTLSFVRSSGCMDDAKLDAFLESFKDPEKHTELGCELDAIRINASEVRKELAKNQPPVTPHHAPSIEHLQLFANGTPFGDKQLLGEYLKLERGHEAWNHQVSGCKTYEFDWGFIIETPSPFVQFEFFVADAWRNGNENYVDRFLSAWKNDAEAQVNDLMDSGKIVLAMDDGRINFNCLSLGCYADRDCIERTRKWLADTFLTAIWPSMVTKALDHSYLFAQEWHTE